MKNRRIRKFNDRENGQILKGPGIKIFLLFISLLSFPMRYFFYGSFVLFMPCVCHAFVSVHRCLVVTCWEKLTSWLSFVMFDCVFVTIPCGILGQVWYLIVSIPDLTSNQIVNSMHNT